MATDTEIAHSTYDNYRFCYDNGHQQWLERAKMSFNFWNDEQWDPQVKAKLQREGRPALTFNLIKPLIRSMKGIQRALRNDVRFMPVADANAESARVRDAVWLHTQQQSNYDYLEGDLWQKGLIMDRAYVDLRLEYDESLQGWMCLRPRRSQDVVLDPTVDQYDPDTWPQVITRRWVSYNDLIGLWGKEKADAVGANVVPAWMDYEDQFMAHQMGRIPHYYHDVMCGLDEASVRGHLLLERQYFTMKNKRVFIDLETGDFNEIPEDWGHNKISHVLSTIPGVGTMKRMVKTIRWDVTCDGEVMHSDDSIYKHFTIVPFFPDFVDGTTGGAVWPLIDSQQLFNKMTSSELHIIATTANSGIKIKSGAIRNMNEDELEAYASRPGGVFVLDDINNMEKIQPSQIPAGHDRLSFKADQIMQKMSGVSESGRGFARDDASGDKVMQDQAAQDVNFAGWLSNLHYTKSLLARNANDCAAAHYSETRLLLINRGTTFSPKIEPVTINQPTAEGSVINDVTRGKFSTVLVPSPTRTSLSTEDFDMVLKMRELGIAIPDTMLIELAPLVNKAEIISDLAGGPDSNDRQRQAEELAAQQQAVDQQKAVATARKEEAAAMLNQARAEKFAVEAASDPDASYERVEMARMQQDDKHHGDQMDLEYAKLNQKDKQDQRKLAFDLSSMDVDSEHRAADRKVKQQERRPAARKNSGLTRKSA